MSATAALAPEGTRPRRRLVAQLWFVVGIDRIMSEGRALTNATGNSVATMVIAGWAGERDDERFRAVLAEPSIVDREVERALSGADADGEGGDGTGAPPRFERDPAIGAHVPAGARPER